MKSIEASCHLPLITPSLFPPRILYLWISTTVLEPNRSLLHKNRLLRDVARTNNDYGLGVFELLQNPGPKALAVFSAVELQAPTFFASRLVVWAMGLHAGDPLICIHYLQ